MRYNFLVFLGILLTCFVLFQTATPTFEEQLNPFASCFWIFRKFPRMTTTPSIPIDPRRPTVTTTTVATTPSTTTAPTTLAPATTGTQATAEEMTATPNGEPTGEESSPDDDVAENNDDDNNEANDVE